MCYDGFTTPCEFLCGHSFCYQCVKTWYQKGTSTCPMCRGGMCFRGMRGVKQEWEDEMREGVLHDFIDFLIEDLGNSEYGMDVLSFVYERYNTLLKICPEIDEGTLAYILRAPYFTIKLKRMGWEVPTYMRYLMVPKTAWGVMDLTRR